VNDLITIWVEIQIRALGKSMEVRLVLEVTVVDTAINMVDGKFDLEDNIKTVF
jgi:hypothetical protein